MLTASVLNEDATLNFFKESHSAQFVRGSSFKFVGRLKDTVTGHRFIPPEGSTLSISFVNVDNEIVTKETTPVSEQDTSMFWAQITPSESELLAPTNVILTLEWSVPGEGEGAPAQEFLVKGLIPNALQMVIINSL